jgi:hypothetical protein
VTPWAAQPDRVISGLGGTGTGTMMAGGGLQAGPETTLGKVLLLMSPATSVVAGSLLLYLHMTVNRWLEDREADRARGKLRRALDDPHVPEPDKEEFRRLLAGFERSQIERELERVRAIGRVPDQAQVGSDPS